MKRLLSPAVLSLCFSVSVAAASDDAARSNNAFCFSLMAQKGGSAGNDVFSPFSIWSALAMTSAGAQDETLAQMQKVLHLPGKDWHSIVSRWTANLKAAHGVQMKIANRLWGKKGLAFRPEFLKLAEKEYGAGLQTMNFTGNPDGSRKQINQWVSDQTESKIKDLLAPGTINKDTRLVLTNAVYFNGKWAVPFNANNTHKREFTLATGKKIEPQTMEETFAAGYMEDKRLQAVRLDYEGSDTAMIVVLPRQTNALEGPSFLDAEGFGKVLSSMKDEKRVVVQMPKFEASAKLQLAALLKAMGMSRAFSDGAQFGIMCDDPLKISEVIHQAWIKVAEKGTEAAAATAVGVMSGRAMPQKQEPPKMFIADHPFLFFVIDKRNGGIVFAGRVMDPTH
jgi:serine protease inhibitor